MQQKVLNEFVKFENFENVRSVDLANSLGMSHDELVSVLKSLESRFYFVLDLKSSQRFVLTPEGEEYK